jgi:hypothetical protein
VFCILALFVLAAVLATFKKIGNFFPKSSGHPDGKLDSFELNIAKRY